MIESLSSFKSAIGSVTGLVKLIEPLLTAPQKRREGRFEAFIRPLHDKLQEVHLDYSETFRMLERGLPSRYPDGSWTIPDESGFASANDALNCIAQKKSQYRSDREKQESVRDLLRQNAYVILRALHSEKEQQYVYSLIVYFQEDAHRPFQDSDYLQQKVEAIIEKGVKGDIRTPTTTLLAQLNETDDPEEIRKLAKHAIYELNQRFSDVAKQYCELQKDVIDGMA